VARIHRMTPARRNALRKAQLASARKRKGSGRTRPSNLHKGKRHITKNQKRALVGVAAVAAVGAAAYGAHKARYVTVYHGTRHHAARQITKHGFNNGKGPNARAHDVYLTSKRRTGNTAYGTDVVKVKMRRKDAKKILHKAPTHPRNAKWYTADQADLKKAKITHVKSISAKGVRKRHKRALRRAKWR
jgi:hypothetical protein